MTKQRYFGPRPPGSSGLTVPVLIERLLAEAGESQRGDDEGERVRAAIEFGIETEREVEILMLGLGWSPHGGGKWGRVVDPEAFTEGDPEDDG